MRRCEVGNFDLFVTIEQQFLESYCVQLQLNTNFSKMPRNLYHLFAICTNIAENVGRLTALLYLFTFRIFLFMNLKACHQNEITGLRLIVALHGYKISHLLEGINLNFTRIT